jgi:hypothetical protein
MKNAKPLFAALASATLFSACLFQDDPEPRASARFEFKAAASSALAKGSASEGFVISDSSGVRVTLTEALIHIKKIQLKAVSGNDSCDSSGSMVLDGEKNEKGCEDGAEATVQGGPYLLDLLTGASTPDIGTLTFPVGEYDRVKIHIHHAEGNDSSATSLGGNTLSVKGTYSLEGGAEMPFALALRFNEIIQIRNAAGMKLDETALHTILVGLNAGDWLSGLDIKGCLASMSAGGAAVVNEDSDLGKCLDAEHRIKDNFRTSFKVQKE